MMAMFVLGTCFGLGMACLISTLLDWHDDIRDARENKVPGGSSITPVDFENVERRLTEEGRAAQHYFRSK